MRCGSRDERLGAMRKQRRETAGKVHVMWKQKREMTRRMGAMQRREAARRVDVMQKQR